MPDHFFKTYVAEAFKYQKLEKNIEKSKEKRKRRNRCESLQHINRIFEVCYGHGWKNSSVIRLLIMVTAAAIDISLPYGIKGPKLRGGSWTGSKQCIRGQIVDWIDAQFVVCGFPEFRDKSKNMWRN